MTRRLLLTLCCTAALAVGAAKADVTRQDCQNLPAEFAEIGWFGTGAFIGRLARCIDRLAAEREIEFVRPATYGAGWSTYSESYRNFEYALSADGIVRLRGMMAGCPSTETAVFTLPEGLRPKYRLIFKSLGQNLLARVDIERDGQVFYWWNSAGTCPNRHWLSLDGISFAAEQ